MVIPSFAFSRIPGIYFGAGRFRKLAGIVGDLGRAVLVVTGSQSLKSSGRWDDLIKSLKNASITHFHVSVTKEPSPGDVDAAVSDFKDKQIDVVLAVGGGSALDAGKAISAMLLQGKPVVEFLEGLGTGESHDGKKIPFVAVPTTSGTGSEATRNAVLSRVGPGGFKKSLRHENFVPDVALIDPELMVSCPPHITAAAGLDACTQLLEAYVSPQASPLTDVLAYQGLEYVADNLILACTEGAGDTNVRAGMAYAALLSGIVLANAGLGIVHGLASPVGAHFPIPHGVVCGTLLASATRENIRALTEESGNDTALKKYARVGRLFSGREGTDVHEGCDCLMERLEKWTERVNLPRLGEYGMENSDVDRIVEDSGLKNNPVKLTAGSIKNIVLRRI